mmetsp:Transcript_68971/g.199731  ORF Transcript_68971/g.199731 Transcript_68971/m.199731 type:complete len:192 (+) Transcript_68971:491-1066(+)
MISPAEKAFAASVDTVDREATTGRGAGVAWVVNVPECRMDCRSRRPRWRRGPSAPPAPNDGGGGGHGRGELRGLEGYCDGTVPAPELKDAVSKSSSRFVDASAQDVVRRRPPVRFAARSEPLVASRADAGTDLLCRETSEASYPGPNNSACKNEFFTERRTEEWSLNSRQGDADVLKILCAHIERTRAEAG